mgnify:CR=1 FL=1
MARKPEIEPVEKCARHVCKKPHLPGSKFCSLRCREIVADDAGKNASMFEAGIPCVQMD